MKYWLSRTLRRPASAVQCLSSETFKRATEAETMLGVANAQLGTAILGLGAAQGMLMSSTLNTLASAQQEHRKRMPAQSSSLPIAISRAVSPSIEASAAAVSGNAGSPPRSSSFVHTRRVLAPSHCLSRTGRRRRPGSGGGPEDDDISDGGSGGADGGGGDDYNDGSWYGDDDSDARGSSGLIWLWQAFSVCVFLQAVHYLATGAKTRDMAQTSALASLTQSLYTQKT
ncbi:g1175 [Coccomyxa viridis]|uniref:G1175 protein n=1 Tax=Coccomyxa viridis TaxID=1274662 RepID=A0ABP1FP88_9CHLO